MSQPPSRATILTLRLCKRFHVHDILLTLVILYFFIGLVLLTASICNPSSVPTVTLYVGLGLYIGSVILLFVFRIPPIRRVLEGDRPRHYWYYWCIYGLHSIFIVVYCILLFTHPDQVDELTVVLLAMVMFNLVLSAVSLVAEHFACWVTRLLWLAILYANVSFSVTYNAAPLHYMSLVNSTAYLVMCCVGLVATLWTTDRWTFATDRSDEQGAFFGVLIVCAWQIAAVGLLVWLNVQGFAGVTVTWPLLLRACFYLVQTIPLLGCIVYAILYALVAMGMCLVWCCRTVQEEIKETDKEMQEESTRLYQQQSFTKD